MQATRVSAPNTRTLPQQERDQIVLDHIPLVKAIAIRVHENLPVHVDLDHLIHAGVMGLFDAVEKYDGAKNVAFHAYAKHRIKGAILDSLRQLDWATRDLRRRQKAGGGSDARSSGRAGTDAQRCRDRRKDGSRSGALAEDSDGTAHRRPGVGDATERSRARAHSGIRCHGRTPARPHVRAAAVAVDAGAGNRIASGAISAGPCFCTTPMT